METGQLGKVLIWMNWSETVIQITKHSIEDGQKSRLAFMETRLSATLYIKELLLLKTLWYDDN